MKNSTERMQDRLYHDLILPEETLEVRLKAREFTERVLARRAYEIATTEESRESFPRDIFKAMADEVFFKIPYSNKFGGTGLSRKFHKKEGKTS